jgi:hypothetical protein
MTSANEAATVDVGFLDGTRGDDVNGVADLHQEFLADSLVVKFGDAFLRKFYYSRLVRDGLIKSTICRADGRVVGFFSYTTDPGFMGVALRRYPLTVLWLVGTSVLRRPSVLKDVLLVLRLLMGSRGDNQAAMAGCASEGLSMAVRQDWSRAVPAGGQSRVSVRLFEELVADLRRSEAKTVCMFVQPLNLSSNLLFSSLGCELSQVTRAGVKCNRYTYDLRRGRAPAETPA